MSDRAAEVATICERYGIEILYSFGGRGREVAKWLNSANQLSSSPSDIDLAVKPARELEVFEKARLAVAFEDMLSANRVDLVVLPEAGAFLAANAIRGERLYAQNEYLADEYDLYVLRRAGDLAPLERERRALVLGKRE